MMINSIPTGSSSVRFQGYTGYAEVEDVLQNLRGAAILEELTGMASIDWRMDYREKPSPEYDRKVALEKAALFSLKKGALGQAGLRALDDHYVAVTNEFRDALQTARLDAQATPELIQSLIDIGSIEYPLHISPTMRSGPDHPGLALERVRKKRNDQLRAMESLLLTRIEHKAVATEDMEALANHYTPKTLTLQAAILDFLA